MKNIIFYCLATLTVFIPLYPKFPLVDIPGTFVSVRLEDVLIAVTLFLWGVWQLKRGKELLKKPITLAFILFWSVGLVSVVSGIFLTETVTPHLAILHWLRRIEVMSLFFIAMTTIQSIKQIKMLLMLGVVVNFLVLFYGFGQLFLDFKVVSTTHETIAGGTITTLGPGGRVNSTFAGHYDLAVYLSFVLIFLTGFFFFVRSMSQKLLLGCITLGNFILLAFTAARVSFAVTFLVIMALLWYLKKRAYILLILVLGIVLVISVPQFRERVAATVTVMFSESTENVYVSPPSPTPISSTSSHLIPLFEQNVATDEALESASESGLARDIAVGESTDYSELEVGRSSDIRFTVEWPRAINAFYRNPILGTGYSSIDLATDNDYLRALGETGLLGFATLGFIFILIIRKVIYLQPSQNPFIRIFSLVTGGAIFAMLLTAFFIDVLEASKIASMFWILVGSLFAVSRIKKHE